MAETKSDGEDEKRWLVEKERNLYEPKIRLPYKFDVIQFSQLATFETIAKHELFTVMAKVMTTGSGCN